MGFVLSETSEQIQILIYGLQMKGGATQFPSSAVEGI